MLCNVHVIVAWNSRPLNNFSFFFFLLSHEVLKNP